MQRRLPLPLRRPRRLAVALGALAAAFAAEAVAQTLSPFAPSLTDPRRPQRFGTPPDAVTRDRAAGTPDPSSAGETGFDSTGSVAKRKTGKPRPGARKAGSKLLLPPPPPPLPGPPQSVGVRPSAQQIGARATYAEAYRPPDAPRQRPPLVPFGEAFDPVGVRAGDFVLRPAIEVARGFDSNPSRVPNGQGSWMTVVTPELQARSQWSRHELGVNLRGSYTAYDSIASLNRPTADARVSGRLDASRDTRLEGEGRFLLGSDNPGSPNVQAGLARFPIYTTLGATLGVAQRFNHFELAVKGSVDRTAYQDSKLTDGTTSSNHDRDYLQYGGQVRASYEVVPGVRPFVEVGADRRVHDVAFDRSGAQRDSQAFTPRVGTTFELSRKLTGEVSVGHLTRRYKDPALAELRGVVADASLVWAASGLTTATLTATSRAEESIVAGVSGALRRDVGVQVDHAFRRWLIGTVKFGYGIDQYVGLGRDDQRTSLGAMLTYKVNRDLWLKGEVRQEWMRSSAPDVDNAATIVLLGIRLAR